MALLSTYLGGDPDPESPRISALARALGNLGKEDAAYYEEKGALDQLVRVLNEYGVTDPRVIEEFMANALHETGNFRWRIENKPGPWQNKGVGYTQLTHENMVRRYADTHGIPYDRTSRDGWKRAWETIANDDYHAWNSAAWYWGDRNVHGKLRPEGVDEEYRSLFEMAEGLRARGIDPTDALSVAVNAGARELPRYKRWVDGRGRVGRSEIYDRDKRREWSDLLEKANLGSQFSRGEGDAPFIDPREAPLERVTVPDQKPISGEVPMPGFLEYLLKSEGRLAPDKRNLVDELGRARGSNVQKSGDGVYLDLKDWRFRPVQSMGGIPIPLPTLKRR